MLPARRQKIEFVKRVVRRKTRFNSLDSFGNEICQSIRVKNRSEYVTQDVTVLCTQSHLRLSNRNLVVGKIRNFLYCVENLILHIVPNTFQYKFIYVRIENKGAVLFTYLKREFLLRSLCRPTVYT